MMDATNTFVPEPEAVTLESAARVINFWQRRAEAAETETADLRERVAERDAELTMLREALDTIPLHEYGDAQREGCDAKGAWDCFKEALTEHVAAVRSVTAVYDAKADVAALRRQLATHDAEASAACQEWDVKCERLAREAVDLRARLEEAEGHVHFYKRMNTEATEHARYWKGRAETAEALVPEADLLCWFADMVFLQTKSFAQINTLRMARERIVQARKLAARIRDWRERSNE